MPSYWATIFAALDAASAKYRPMTRYYLVTDELTAPEGRRVGDRVPYLVWPPVTGWTGIHLVEPVSYFDA